MKSQDFTSASCSWRPLHSPDDAMESPRIFNGTSSFESFSHHLEDLMGSCRFSQSISLNRVIMLVRRSHWKSPGFDSVSWRPLYSPEDASRIPRISQGLPFHRSLYTVQSPDPLEVQIGWMSCDIHTIYRFQNIIPQIVLQHH